MKQLIIILSFLCWSAWSQVVINGGTLSGVSGGAADYDVAGTNIVITSAGGTNTINSVYSWVLTGNGSSGTAASLYYWPLYGYNSSATTTETGMKTYLPGRCYLTNLVLHAPESSISAGTNIIWTVRTNGVATGITVTLSGSTYVVHDFSHYCNVTTNDYVTIGQTNNAILSGAKACWWSIMAVPY